MIDLAQGNILLWRPPQHWESQFSVALSYSDIINKV